MAHTHEFDCQQCGAHLDSRKELDQHVRAEHSQQASGAKSGGESKRNTAPRRRIDHV